MASAGVPTYAYRLTVTSPPNANYSNDYSMVQAQILVVQCEILGLGVWEFGV